MYGLGSQRNLGLTLFTGTVIVYRCRIYQVEISHYQSILASKPLRGMFFSSQKPRIWILLERGCRTCSIEWLYCFMSGQVGTRGVSTAERRLPKEDPKVRFLFGDTPLLERFARVSSATEDRKG